MGWWAAGGGGAWQFSRTFASAPVKKKGSGDGIPPSLPTPLWSQVPELQSGFDQGSRGAGWDGGPEERAREARERPACGAGPSLCSWPALGGGLRSFAEVPGRGQAGCALPGERGARGAGRGRAGRGSERAWLRAVCIGGEGRRARAGLPQLRTPELAALSRSALLGRPGYERLPHPLRSSRLFIPGGICRMSSWFALRSQGGRCVCVCVSPFAFFSLFLSLALWRGWVCWGRTRGKGPLAVQAACGEAGAGGRAVVSLIVCVGVGGWVGGAGAWLHAGVELGKGGVQGWAGFWWTLLSMFGRSRGKGTGVELSVKVRACQEKKGGVRVKILCVGF